MTSFAKQVNDYPFEPADERLVDGTSYVVVEFQADIWKQRAGMTRFAAELLNWLRTNQNGIVLHEPRGANMFGLDRDNDRIWNNTHRFYFSDADNAIAFQEALPELKKHINSAMPLFDPFDDISLEEQDSISLAGMIHYAMGDHYSRTAIETWFWCLDNMGGNVYRDDNRLIFTHNADIVLFKLALTGDERAPIPRLKLWGKEPDAAQ
jgi:hypothetical protein